MYTNTHTSCYVDSIQLRFLPITIKKQCQCINKEWLAAGANQFCAQIVMDSKLKTLGNVVDFLLTT